jgi:hypothetical protein
MEKNYTKDELEAKKVIELKNILRNRNLSTTGKKEYLIDKILNDQKLTAPTVSNTPVKTNPTYFDILPRDIMRMVEEYQAANEPNNKIIADILDELLISNYRYRDKYPTNKLPIFLKNNKIPFDIKYNEELQKVLDDLIASDVNTPEKWKEYYELVDEPMWTITQKNKPVSDKQLVDFIAYILKLRKTKDMVEFVNNILKGYDSKLMVLVDGREYMLGRFEKLVDI